MPNTEEYARFRSLRTFAALDGLRCFSVVLVILHHTRPSEDLGRLSLRGGLGVDMFFVISGFLIVSRLLREREQHGRISLRSFYARRALRILPLYVGFLVGLSLIQGVVLPASAGTRAFFADLPYAVTYTSNWVAMGTLLVITWSLSAEEQFYLLWPPVEKFVRRPGVVLLALLLVSELVRFHVLDGVLGALFDVAAVPERMLYKTTFTPILLGVLLAHLLHAPRTFAWLAPLARQRWSSLALAALLAVSLVVLPRDLNGLPRLVVQLLLTILLASSVVANRYALGVILDAPVVRRVGVLSYGMYLLHVPVTVGARLGLAQLHVATYWLFPLVLLMTIGAAELSYRFYETPFLKLKQRLAR